MRRILAGISDIHAGHRGGLMNPRTPLRTVDIQTGQMIWWTPPMSSTQELLWGYYIQDLISLYRLAGDDEVVVIHAGDATWGQRYAEAMIPDTTQEDQRDIAVYSLLPILQMPNVKKMRLATGTFVHVPECDEARVATALAEITHKDIQTLHMGRLSVDGVKIFVAHHGPQPGSRDWLRGNVATLYLRDRVYQDRRNGLEPADVYIYGHRHEYVHVLIEDQWQDETKTRHLVLLPSYCGMGHHPRKVLSSPPVLVNGLVGFVIVDGRLVDVRPFLHTTDLSVTEEL